MVDYWAADLLPVTKSSSLMPSSGVLLTRRSERICIMRVTAFCASEHKEQLLCFCLFIYLYIRPCIKDADADTDVV